jgi:hypothetical protein
MKRLLLILSLLVSAGTAHALDAISGDLFPYENKASSFTIDVDATKIDRFSIEVTYSTETVLDVPLTGASISSVTDAITVSTNGIATGARVLLSSAPMFAPSPLASGTTYFAVKVSDTLIKLATTYAQAVSRDTIDILATPISSNTFTLRPLAYSAGSAAFSWSASNDGTTYVNVGSVGAASVNSSTQALTAISSTATARLFDWGEFAYKYLRFTFNSATDGAIKLRAFLVGRLRE